MRMKQLMMIASLVFMTTAMLIIPASAQTTLTLNVTLKDEFLHERTSAWYEPNNYTISLEAGRWHVDTFSYSDLELKIIVATDAAFEEQIAESGTGYGNFPTVTFTLDNSSDVYIQVVENSANGDTAGFYNIGVFDMEHEIENPLQISAITTFPITQGDFPPSTVFLFAPFIAILGIMLGGIVFGLIILAISRANRFGPSGISTFTTVRDDGVDMRTVRVPVICPTCGASLHNSPLEWVGPLEAKCSYCGSTVRASFERL